jgi:carbon-monoxide dehydrogenase medium subunit
MKPVAFDYERPRDLAAALALLARSGGKLLAGGQSLGPMLNLRLAQPELLIDLGGVAELRDCMRTADGVRLGAMTTHAAIEDGHIPDPIHGILPRVAAGIAYRAVRNRGTIGGSLAHADPAADWLPALAALDATAIVCGALGERRGPVAQFVAGAFQPALGDDEILAAIEIPAPSAAARWGFVKICRKTGEFAQAIAAVLHDPERGVLRAALGATNGAPIVLDAPTLSSPASGGGPGWGQIEDRLSGFDPIERRLHRAALRRALAEAGM